MRILVLSSCPLDPILGSGKTRLRWSQGLRALGHEVDVFEPKAFEWWHGVNRAVRFRQALGAIGFVRRRLHERDYDLVEFFGGEFGLATKRLSRDRRRPLIVAHTDGFELLASERARDYDPLPRTIGGGLQGWYRRQTHERLSRAAFAFADAFVTGCELDRKRVLELNLFPSDRTAVISPGLDGEYLSASRGVQEKEERVAFTGTWISRKGVKHVLGVMSRILRERPGLRLDLYGTAGRAGAILGQFSPSVRAQIIVHGRLSNQQIAEGLSRAKVFFFPTQYEGFGMALAEAMACGCAPVTTPTGFGAELREAEEALLCGFDDRDAMRHAVLALLDDESLRARVAEGAWRRVRSLSWREQIAKLEVTYRAWMHASPAPAGNGGDSRSRSGWTM